MSAARRDPNDAEELRPTREAVLRPTREPRAPFVPGPQSPRVAPAPRAAQLRAATPVARAVVGAAVFDRKSGGAVVVASFPRTRLPGVLTALGERGFGATLLREAQPGPAGLSRELARALRRATIGATTLGAFGAMIGALSLRAEALVPGFGWLPGPAVGAALLAGVLGALGFALGMLALLVMPARALEPLAAGDRALVAITGGDTNAALAATVELAGTAVAHE